MSVETLLKNITSVCGEGPHWDDASQSLLFVEICDGIIFRWDSNTGKYESHKFDDMVGFIVPCRKGGYLLGVGKSVCHFDWGTKKLTTLATVDEGKHTRFNDAKCDASGRLWCGTMDLDLKEPTGSLYSFELDGTIRLRREKATISNGLAWSDDNKTMYYIDSTPRKVWKYDFDLATGNMSNERTVVDYGSTETLKEMGFPDGMTIDTENNIWVACYGGSRIFRFDPNTGKELTSVKFPARRKTSCCWGGKNLDELYVTSGKELTSVKFPARRITSCCWGGKNLDELYVTCATQFMTDEEKAETPLAGSVFRVTGLGFKGRSAYMYEGALNKL